MPILSDLSRELQSESTVEIAQAIAAVIDAAPHGTAIDALLMLVTSLAGANPCCTDRAGFTCEVLGWRLRRLAKSRPPESKLH